MKSLDKRRFDALAGYTRAPPIVLVVQEFEWLATDDERVLGVLTWDRQDYDFGWVALGRDERLRFRGIGMDACLPSAEAARAALTAAMERFSSQPDSAFHQGDTERGAVDFFTPVVPEERLNPTFRHLITQEGYSPARELIAAMMRFYEDVDGNFIEQFQTTGFDTRLWELYLFATFTELGFARDTEFDIPDFPLVGLDGNLGVEATTANAGGTVAWPESPEEAASYLENYIPIKLGRALKRKLKRKVPYWSLPHMRGVPFALALQDFHGPGSMKSITPVVTEYLFGYRHSVVNGQRKIERIEGHRYGSLFERSGFFDLPGAENVSAVIVNPQGTLTKFNRMGHLAGFGSERVKMVRRGLQRNERSAPGSGPTYFVHEVGDERYPETWIEGMVVLHNPKALIRLDPGLLPGANHEFVQPDGRIMSMLPQFHPYFSETIILVPEPK